MNFPRLILHSVLLPLAAGLIVAQSSAQSASAHSKPDYEIGAHSMPPIPVDAEIAKALRSITPTDIEKTVRALVSFGTRNTLTSMETDLLPGRGINAAADWIEAQFNEISAQCGSCLSIHRDTFTLPVSERVTKPTTLTNVYAILKGSDAEQSKRMVLVTGHYDSINSNVFKNWADTSGDAPGANDDASGVAVSLACARALSKLHLPATVVFVAVAGEEEGLLGSEHLAKLAKDEGWQLDAVLNNDIVGGNTTPGDKFQLKDRVRVFSEGVPATATPEQARRIRALGEEADSPSRQIARYVDEVARAYFPASRPEGFTAFLVDRPDRYLRGGDHTSFNKEGFAAVRFSEWHEDYNHQHQNVVMPAPGAGQPIMGDLIQFVDFAYLARVARLNAATLASLASAPGAPKNVKIDTKKLEDGTTLHWDAPDEAPNGIRYEVVWRETTSPKWQYALPPMTSTDANGTDVTLTLPISKDNVYFGVRAVDLKGHRSPVVVP